MLWRSGAIRLLVVFHLIGPSLFFYSVAYWLVKPQDWSGPALPAPLSLFLTIGAQILGVKMIHQATDSFWKVVLISSQIAGPVGGLAIGIMIYFLLRP